MVNWCYIHSQYQHRRDLHMLDLVHNTPLHSCFQLSEHNRMLSIGL
jgi:hypothetical protein